jgi:hypothetical protein
VREIARVEDKPKVVNQVSLGTAERILEMALGEKNRGRIRNALLEFRRKYNHKEPQWRSSTVSSPGKSIQIHLRCPLKNPTISRATSSPHSDTR